MRTKGCWKVTAWFNIFDRTISKCRRKAAISASIPSGAARRPCSISWTPSALIAPRNSPTARHSLRTCRRSNSFEKQLEPGLCLESSLPRKDTNNPMTREEVRTRITEIGIIPAVRLHSAADALFAAEAVCSAGIPIVEVTTTVPGAVDVIRELARQSPEIIVGAGTLIYADSARRCLDAGAKFLTTTGFDLDIVNLALGRDTVVFPGALTPSEIMTAWKTGCDFVKIFPCAQVGGPGYIR